MSGDAGRSIEAAAVVAAELDHRESSLLRELVGDQDAVREVGMGDDSRSELAELYTKVRVYRVISLLDVFSKLVKCTAAHLIADHLERKHGLHDGQYGCRKRRSCINAVAVLMNRTQQV